MIIILTQLGYPVWAGVIAQAGQLIAGRLVIKGGKAIVRRRRVKKGKKSPLVCLMATNVEKVSK